MSIRTIIFLSVFLAVSFAQRSEYKCSGTWCYNKAWMHRQNRVLRFNYTKMTVLQQVPINYTRLRCIEPTVIGPNSDQCVFVNETVVRNITFPTTTFKRDEEPAISNLGSSVSVIATDNQDPLRRWIANTTYEPLHDKIWQIWVPKGCRMLLFVDDFDVESEANCSNDFLAIQEKKRGKVTKYCGGISSLPSLNNYSQIEIRHRRVQITFHSDHLHTRRGLYATYCFQNSKSITNPPCSCNINTAQTAGGSGADELTAGSLLRPLKSIEPQKRHISKKQMRKEMKIQDALVQESISTMMRNPQAINKYKQYSHRDPRYSLAMSYEKALSCL